MSNMRSIYAQLDARLREWIYVRRFEARGTSERGATLTEYALLVALLAVMCIASIEFLGSEASSKLSQVGASIGQP